MEPGDIPPWLNRRNAVLTGLGLSILIVIAYWAGFRRGVTVQHDADLATPAPRVVQAPKPTATPKTPVPTNTHAPTATAPHTRTPTSTATPRPSATSRPSPTPQPTAIPDPSVALVPPASTAFCPLDPQICSFAAKVDDALHTGDVDGFVALAAYQQVPCVQADSAPDSMCAGAPPGDLRPGLQVVHYPEDSGYRYLSAAQVKREFVDANGKPIGLRLASIACPGTISQLRSCGDLFSLILISRYTEPGTSNSYDTFRSVLVSWPIGQTPSFSLIGSGLTFSYMTTGGTAPDGNFFVHKGDSASSLPATFVRWVSPTPVSVR